MLLFDLQNNFQIEHCHFIHFKKKYLMFVGLFVAANFVMAL